MDWSTQSPERKPIENLWDLNCQRDRVQEKNPPNVHDLWTSVKTAWDEFLLTKITTFIESK